jgi:hypothetical protein
MWLACYTQQEIADAEGMDHSAVSRILCEVAELPKSTKPAANHEIDFDIPLYNVWKQQEKTAPSGPPRRRVSGTILVIGACGICE